MSQDRVGQTTRGSWREWEEASLYPWTWDELYFSTQVLFPSREFGCREEPKDQTNSSLSVSLSLSRSSISLHLGYLCLVPSSHSLILPFPLQSPVRDAGPLHVTMSRVLWLRTSQGDPEVELRVAGISSK